jgi:oligopeptide transport system substrate-binding protein
MRNGKKFTRGFLPTLLVLVAMLVVACGGTSTTTTTGQHTKASAANQVLIWNAGAGVADIATFDPALVQDFFSNAAIQMVFTGLVKLNNDNKVETQLASSYDVAADKMTYTFHLKPDLKFSDGTPLTSQDVIYSMNRALAPKTQSLTAPYYMRYIKDATAFNNGKIPTLIGDSLKAPDPNTVVIIAGQPIAFFLETLTYSTNYVVEKKLIDQYGKNWTDHLTEGGGSGPFKVQEYTHSKQIVFVPNDTYYGSKPQLAKVVMPFYKETDTTYQVYNVNGIDVTAIPLSNFEQAKTSKEFKAVPQLWTNYYTMNYLQKPFDVTECRQAFALAINKDLIVKSVWKNSNIATNHIVPQGQYGFNPNLTGPQGATTAGDQTKAKAALATCLQKEGYSEVSKMPSVTLTYSSAGIQAARDEVAAMQQMWQSTLGINVKTNDIDINKLFSYEGQGSGNPLQFYTGPAWIADYPDPQDWTSLQFAKGVSQNGMSFGQNNGADAAAQQAVQQELAQADLMQDPNAREAAYNKAEQELVNFVAWMPMEQVTSNLLVKPCVQNYVFNAQGLFDPEQWSKIYISTDTPCAKTS